MNDIVVRSRRRSLESIRREHQGATIVDVTSRGPAPWNRFSPFFAHGGIPVPFSPDLTAQSVEGIWQGLKVFEHSGVDLSKLDVVSGRGLKRTTRRFGRVLGHQKGVSSNELLDYVTARKLIYVPSYRWVLDNRLEPLLAELTHIARQALVVLLDYDTNADIEDPSRPLSHASLVRARLLE